MLTDKKDWQLYLAIEIEQSYPELFKEAEETIKRVGDLPCMDFIRKIRQVTKLDFMSATHVRQALRVMLCGFAFEDAVVNEAPNEQTTSRL